MSLINRVILTVAVALLPVVGVDLYNEAVLRRAQMTDLRQQVQREARSVATELDRTIAAVRNAMVAIAEHPAMRSGDSAACSRVLEAARGRLAFVRDVTLVGGDGQPLCSSDPGMPRNTSAPALALVSAPALAMARERQGFVIAGYRASRVAGEPDLAMAMPLGDSTELPGTPVLVANVSLVWLQHELALRPRPHEAALVLADRDGLVLAELPWANRIGAPWPEADHWTAAAARPRIADRIWADGKRRITGYERVGAPPGELFLEVGFSVTTAFAAREAAASLRLELLGAGLTLALASAALLARRTIGQPMASVLRTIHAWRLGEASARVPVAANGWAIGSDVGRVAHALNDLLAAFERTRDDLLAREDTLTRRIADRTRELEAETREREEAQARLQQAQKMEVIGQLTGGIAHDFNNLLTAIIGNLELAALRGRDNPSLTRLLVNATRAADRGAALTQRMLAFGRRQHLRLEPVALGPLLRGMGDLLARTIGTTVVIELDVADDVAPVRADVGQVELLLLNLAINARDAMPGGGQLRIRARNVVVADGLPHPAQLAPGDYAAISLSDTGAGMGDQTLARALEPFFTTKPVGQGSGLGLSMAQGVAAQSGGGLLLESRLGFGTTVTVWLPHDAGAAAREPLAVPAAEAARHPGAAAAASPGAVILLVDDDPEVLSAAEYILEFGGHTVCCAEHGAAALALAQAGLRVDLMVADLAMPGMSGVMLADAVRQLQPGLPVLLTTGYAAIDLEPGRASRPDLPVLAKPFKAAQLLEAVARLLADRQTA